MEDVCCQILYLSDSSFTVLLLSMPPPGGHRGVMTTPVRARKKTTAHTGHFVTAAILKFIEIDWFLQIIGKLILPLNTETKRGRPSRPQHQNRRLMAVKMCRDQYYQLKNKHTRALKSAWSKTAVKTGQFFFSFDYLTHFVTNRFMIIIDIKSVSYWTIFPMKINKPQASSATFYKSKTLWNVRENK